MNKKSVEDIIDLFLRNPETGENLVIVSDLYDEGFGQHSFVVRNENNGNLWKHTFKTEETELNE